MSSTSLFRTRAILFSMALVGPQAHAQAQLIIVNYDPPLQAVQLGNGITDTEPFDIDQDGIADMALKCSSEFYAVHQDCCWSYSNGIERSFDHWAMAVTNVPSASLSTCGRVGLDGGTSIGSDLDFSLPAQFFFWFYRSGPPLGLCGVQHLDSIRYFPIQATLDDGIHYGYLLVQPGHESIKLFASGFSPEPDVPILTGPQVSVPEQTPADVRWFLDPSTGKLIVRMPPSSARIDQCTLHDITGRTRATSWQLDDEGALVMDLQDLPAGIHFLRITQGPRVFTVRFLIP